MITSIHARILLIIGVAIIAACMLFVGWELGKSTPCSEMESFDIRPMDN